MTRVLKSAVCEDESQPAAVPREITGAARVSRIPRSAVLASTIYLAVAIWLSGIRPLWLDEILQLRDTRQPSPAVLLARLPANHLGSAPLGYLTQQLALRITGYSTRRSRLPAAIFGSAAVLAVYILATHLGLLGRCMGTMLFAAFPLVLRYSTESRPYSQALFFSVVATILYVKLANRRRWQLAAAYTVALAAAAYAQPYSASVGLAHVLWSYAYGERKTAACGIAALAAACLSFLPWFWWSHPLWAQGLAAGAWRSSVSLSVPLVLFRELAGAGYWGSGLLMILCVLAMVRRTSTPRARVLLILLVAVPTTVALAADAYFGYFLAARQFLWVLPALALLAGSIPPGSRAVRALRFLLPVVCLWQSARFYDRPREDWQAAANALWENARQGACIAVAPPDQAILYEFFQAGLVSNGEECSRLVLAVTPYAKGEQEAAALAGLRSQGYRQVRETLAGGSRLIRFHRPPGGIWTDTPRCKICPGTGR